MSRSDELEERLAALLLRWDYQRSPAEVVALGGPALERLLDASDGKGTPWHEGANPRDYEDALHAAVAAFGRDDLEAVLAEARRRGWDSLRVVLSGLGGVADARVVLMLLEMVSSKDSLVRLRAVGYLAAQADPRATEALIRALADRNESVRSTAIDGLAEKGEAGAVEALQAFAKRSAGTPWLAKSARAAIAKIRKARRTGRGVV